MTPNAALDRTLSVPNFRLGHRHRSVDTVTLPGGKGVNVARALRNLGAPVIATGFAGGSVGAMVVERLDREAIPNDFVRIEDESRTSTAVVDPTSGGQTEINEKGPHIGEAEVSALAAKVKYLCRGAKYCIFAGSVPSGVPEEIYGDLVRDLRGMGVSTVVDCEGSTLDKALRAGPGVVSPNLREAEQLVGQEFEEIDDRVQALDEICRRGARSAVVTETWGCWARISDDGERRYFRVAIEPFDPVSPIGSGDSFVAGFVASRYEGAPADEALRFGVACGAESTRHFGAGRLDRREAQRLIDAIELIEVDRVDVGT